MLIAQSLLGFVTRNLGDFKVGDSQTTVSSALRNQWMLGLVVAALYVGATVFATKASDQLNTHVTGP